MEQKEKAKMLVTARLLVSALPGCTIIKTLERKCTRMANLRVNDFRVDRNETNTHRKTLQRDSKRSNQLNGRCTLFSVMEVETQKKKPTIDAPPCGRNDEKRRPNNQ
jgi:hypothetical protein